MKLIHLPPPSRPQHDEVLDVADKLGEVLRHWTAEEGHPATAMMVVVTLADGAVLTLRAGDDTFRLLGGLTEAQHQLLKEDD